MAQSKLVGPDDATFSLDDYFFYNLNYTATIYTDEMSKALEKQGLSTTQWRILMILDDTSHSSVGELARRSFTKISTITKMLDRMAKEGLVVRIGSKTDRRIVGVKMTPKAVEILRTVKRIGQSVFESALQGIDPEDAKTVTRLLKEVRSNLEQPRYSIR